MAVRFRHAGVEVDPHATDIDVHAVVLTSFHRMLLSACPESRSSALAKHKDVTIWVSQGQLPTAILTQDDRSDRRQLCLNRRSKGLGIVDTDVGVPATPSRRR